MKKLVLAALVLLFSSAIYAQDLNFAINFGVLTDKDFKFNPLYFSGGIQLDYNLGSYVMISPELTFYSDSKFESASMTLAPGAVLNFKAGPLFLGGGVVQEIWLQSGGGTIPLEMKLNAGLRSSGLRLGMYLLTPFKDLFTEMSIGFTIGFEF